MKNEVIKTCKGGQLVPRRVRAILGSEVLGGSSLFWTDILRYGPVMGARPAEGPGQGSSQFHYAVRMFQSHILSI